MNTMTIGRVEESTGPLLDDASVAVPDDFWARSSESDMASEVDSATVAKALKRPAEGRTTERVALLGYLLAELDGVSFGDAAVLLSTKEVRLQRLMHGEEFPTTALGDRWVELAKVLENLHTMVRGEATGRWFTTPVPSLGGRTPLEAIRKGKLTDVLELTRGYLEPSFS